MNSERYFEVIEGRGGVRHQAKKKKGIKKLPGTRLHVE